MSNNYREAIDAVTQNGSKKGPYEANWKGLIQAITDNGTGGGGGSVGTLQEVTDLGATTTNDITTGHITSPVLTTSDKKTDFTGDIEVTATNGDEGIISTGSLSMQSVQSGNTTTWNSYIQQGFSGSATGGNLQIQNGIGGILIWSDNDSASSITLRVNSDIAVKNMVNVDSGGMQLGGALDLEGLLILKSPNGTKYKVEVQDDGTLITTAV